ncbi:MAG: protein-export chaperone SecB [Wenzhouxiangella sp.]|jgi:preprotein translocase subunit SecB|nr:protein-export chaperone SecB [Wenzhouxiangella sp.]
MAEEAAGNSDGTQAGATENSGMQMVMQHIYLKDASFEAKSPQELDQSGGQPDINLNLAQRTAKVGEDRVEVILTVTVTAKQGESTAFVCEVQYGGIFQFANVTEEQMPYVINVLCPNVLFPYNRAQIGSMITAGGFYLPPLQPINFEAVFRQRLTEAQKQQAEGAAGDGSVN